MRVGGEQGWWLLALRKDTPQSPLPHKRVWAATVANRAPSELGRLHRELTCAASSFCSVLVQLQLLGTICMIAWSAAYAPRLTPTQTLLSVLAAAASVPTLLACVVCPAPLLFCQDGSFCQLRTRRHRADSGESADEESGGRCCLIALTLMHYCPLYNSIRVSEEDERLGLDFVEHGVYNRKREMMERVSARALVTQPRMCPRHGTEAVPRWIDGTSLGEGKQGMSMWRERESEGTRANYSR